MPSRYLQLLQEGQKALHKNEYQSARSKLDEALALLPRSSTNQWIGIMDLRTQTSLGLAEWEIALTDARSMIRKDRGDARGYLRCGQICRLRDDHPAARTWYQQGLKNVRPGSKGHEQLDPMLKRVIAKIDGHKSRLRDPMICLNQDLIYMVFDYLNYKQTVVCLRVSRTWFATLPLLHGLWRTVDLEVDREVSLIMLRSCLGRLSKPPKTLKLGKISRAANLHLRKLMIPKWETLEHLSLNSHTILLDELAGDWPSTLKSLTLGPDAPLNLCEVQDLLHRLTRLEQASFSRVIIHEPSNKCLTIDCRQEAFKARCSLSVLGLKHLVLLMDQQEPRRPPSVLSDVAGRFPNLESLHVSRWPRHEHVGTFSAFSKLRTLKLERCRITHRIDMPSSIRKLTIIGCYYDHRLIELVDNVVIAPLAKAKEHGLPNLKFLCHDLDGGEVIFTAILDCMRCSKSPLLHTLCGPSTSAALMRSLGQGKLSELKMLYLFDRGAEVGLLDEHVEAIAADCPRLEAVELNCRAITGIAVKALCLGPSLQFLTLDRCSKVSADAIEWARSRIDNVVVKQTTGSSELSGRRVFLN